MIQPSGYRSDRVVGSGARLPQVWESGGFALTVQVPPPVTSRQLAWMAEQLARFDAVVAAEAQDGTIALSSMAQAVLLQRAGLFPMVQLSSHAKNRLALQGDILGLGALAIPCVLIDTRSVEWTSFEHRSGARLVTDLDGPALLATAARLRDEARFLSGASIKTPPVFSLGALIDLAAPLAAGLLESAQFLVTAPLAGTQHLSDLLATFQHTHADVLRSRPLLVSVPCTQRSPSGQVRTAQDAWQTWLATLQEVRQYEAVRGCNLVLEQPADLALLDQGTGAGQFFSERSE